MKTIFTLAGVVCFCCSALHAGMYLVALQAANGQYLCADNGGGGGLDANRWAVGPWETFVVEDLWAGTPEVAHGDPVGVRNAYTNKYWCTEPTNNYLVVNRDVRGPWETFLVAYLVTSNGSYDPNHWRFVVYREGWGPQGGSYTSDLYAQNGGGGSIKWGNNGTYSYTYSYFTPTILAYTPDPAP